MLYDSTYMRYPEQSNSQRQNVEWWFPEAGLAWGEMECYGLNDTEFQF